MVTADYISKVIPARVNHYKSQYSAYDIVANFHLSNGDLIKIAQTEAGAWQVTPQVRADCPEVVVLAGVMVKSGENDAKRTDTTATIIYSAQEYHIPLMFIDYVDFEYKSEVVVNRDRETPPQPETESVTE